MLIVYLVTREKESIKGSIDFYEYMLILQWNSLDIIPATIRIAVIFSDPDAREGSVLLMGMQINWK